MGNEQRGGFASSFGFLMAAVGSAVGLGNLWGFPYKMGANGGFAFLLVYLVLAVLVGFVIMLGEFVIGRKTGKSVLCAYPTLGKKYKFLGVFGVVVPVLILSFYCVLGGYCIKYALANLGDVFGASWGYAAAGVDTGTFFGAFTSDMGAAVVFSLIFVVLTGLIILGGVSDGIEKFSKVAMPALFVLLVVVIIRSVTLPGAGAGLEFMFKPNWEPFAGLGWLSVLKTAAGQMFFSLSLGMGIMVTFGSYLPKSENLIKQSIVVPAADTLVAIMAGLAVMPAVFAAGLEPGAGPGLLFVTLQTVFESMGGAGPIFGFMLYFLVFIAAITSSVSLLEVLTSSFIDKAEEKGKTPNRKLATIVTTLVVCAGATLVSVDGLGANGVWVPFQSLFEEIPVWCDCWLDFFDCISEGILMPVSCLIMSLLIGWKWGPKFLQDEIEQEGNVFKAKGFIMFCFKFAAPVILLFVLFGQLVDFGILNVAI